MTQTYKQKYNKKKDFMPQLQKIYSPRNFEGKISSKNSFFFGIPILMSTVNSCSRSSIMYFYNYHSYTRQCTETSNFLKLRC